MHEIEPFYNWMQHYNVADDPNSPFYGKQYNYDQYSENIYGYFIDPAWDYMGSDTLYIKILFTDYESGFTIIEFIGEWNDAINNDIMHLKRNVIEPLMLQGIHRYILIGENILNFHGSDDCYYEEWFDELEDSNELPGWIAAINFREFVMEEWKEYNIDSYINFGGTLQLNNWRTLEPKILYALVGSLIQRRIALT